MPNFYNNFGTDPSSFQEDGAVISASFRPPCSSPCFSPLDCGCSSGCSSGCDSGCRPACFIGSPGPMGPPGPRGFPGIPGPPGLSGLSAFGGRYNDSEQTIIIPAEGEEVIELPETLPSLNAIYGTDNIIINRPGIYRVEFMVMLGASTGTVGAQIYVRLNGVAIPSSVLEVSLTTSFQNLNLSTFVLLAPGNILDLAISSTAGGTVVFGPSVNANLSVMKISV